MATILNTTFKLKRGTAARWAEVNPILEQGEPGFVYDQNRLKIGDGVTPWNDLPYIGEHNIVNCKTHYDFPTIGNENYIYKAKDESLLYQWDNEKFVYVSLGAANINNENIEFIDGGTAADPEEDVGRIDGGDASGDY